MIFAAIGAVTRLHVAAIESVAQIDKGVESKTLMSPKQDDGDFQYAKCDLLVEI